MYSSIHDVWNLLCPLIPLNVWENLRLKLNTNIVNTPVKCTLDKTVIFLFI